jgi:AraC-like DNA-binding protein
MGYIHIDHVRRTGPFTMTNNHFHEFYEIYYLVKGEREYFIKDRVYRVQAGDVVFINKRELHRTIDTGAPGHERILLSFDAEFLQGFETGTLLSLFQPSRKILSAAGETKLFIERLFLKMLQEWTEKPFGYEIFLRTLLQQLLLTAIRHFRESDHQHHAESSSPIYATIMQIVKYISEHYMETISLEQLSSAYNLSPHYISRKFKEITGYSLVEYLQSIRILEAQTLLRETRLKVTEIAARVGFNDLSHFGRVFQQISGTTPLRYRKKTNLNFENDPAL